MSWSALAALVGAFYAAAWIANLYLARQARIICTEAAALGVSGGQIAKSSLEVFRSARREAWLCSFASAVWLALAAGLAGWGA